MLRRFLLPALGALAAVPATASAQTQSCDLENADRLRREVLSADMVWHRFWGNVRFQCEGGVRIRADSATVMEWAGEIQLMGNVVYEDSAFHLTAEWVNQISRDAWLHARTDVVLTDRRSGHVVRGNELQHNGRSEFRTRALTVVMGQPTALLQSTGGPEARRRAPVHVRADRMEIDDEGGFSARGNAVMTQDGEPGAPPLEITAARMDAHESGEMRAFGGVTVRRGGAHGTGDEAEFHQEEDRMVLRGDAVFREEDRTLAADTIIAVMEGDSPTEIMANGRASLEADDAHVEGARLRLLFEDGELARMIAVGDPGAPRDARGAIPSLSAEPDPGLARAVSQDFETVADSVDAIAPGGVIEEVWAVGRAFARRLSRPAPEEIAADAGAHADPDAVADDADDDATAGDPPEEDPTAELLELLAGEWVQGDTVVAYFTDGPDGTGPAELPVEGAPEGTVQDRVVERIVAVGRESAPASAMYGMVPADGGVESRWYTLSTRIVITLRDGEVASVEAADGVRTISLQPIASAGTADRGP